MKALIIYDSVFGNTELIAKAIVSTLSQSGQARSIPVVQTYLSELEGLDIVIIGSPTHRRKSIARARATKVIDCTVEIGTQA